MKKNSFFTALTIAISMTFFAMLVILLLGLIIWGLGLLLIGVFNVSFAFTYAQACIISFVIIILRLIF